MGLRYSENLVEPTENEAEGEPPYDFERVLDAPEEFEISIQSEVFFWAVVDEYATDQQRQRLESMITEHDAARQTFVQCMQLHVDLIYYFHGKRSRDQKDESPPTLWPTILEPVLIYACPDREQREKASRAGKHNCQQLDEMLSFVDDPSSQLVPEACSLDIKTVEHHTTFVGADDIVAIHSLNIVESRNKKPFLSRIIGMFGIR